MLSFLNQALFGNDNESDRNTNADNGKQTPAWRDVTNFYHEYEQTLKKFESLDVSWAAKHDKDAELEEAVGAFASSANVIAEALVRLANVHPIIGVAVSAYHSVLTITLPSVIGHKKVLLVMLQMQSMMSTLFQLRHVKYTIRTKAGTEKTPLQSLLIAIATDILQCGHDLNYFMSREIPFQLLVVNIFEKKVVQQIKMLVTRRNELHSLLSDRSSLGITRSRTNTAISAIGHMLQQADPKLHNFMAHFVKKIRTPLEVEAVKLLEGTKTAPTAEKLNAYVNIYAEFFLRFMSGSRISGYTGSVLRNIVLEAVTSKWEPDAFSLSRFKKFIDVLDQDSERKLLSRQKAMQRMFQQLHMTVSLPTVVRMSALGGRTKSVYLGPFVDLEDVEMTEFWTKMNFGTSVEIDTLILSYRHYLTNESSVSSSDSLVPIPTHPESVYGSICVENNPSLSGSLYEPGSTFIPVTQAHKFALERPEGMSLASWMAYWSSGWRINITTYRDEIFSLMHKMHEASSRVHIANTSHVGAYLNSPFFIYVDGLFKFIGAETVSEDNHNELVEVARSIAKSQEEQLLANLSDVSFIFQSAGEVELVGGFARIETFILPLLYILLQRHLAVIEIAQSVPIMDMEMFVHMQTLHNVFEVFYKRMNDLEAKFKAAQQDVKTQFKAFAHGMFHSSFTLDPTGKTDISSTLSTFRNLHHPSSQLYTSPGPARAKAVDASILVKGPGKGPVYHDIDRSIVRQTDQRTHELEGSWCANNAVGIGCINIGPIVTDHGNGTIEGNGESLMAAYMVTGRFEPSETASSSSTTTRMPVGSTSIEKSEKSKSEKPTVSASGYLDVYIKYERQPAVTNARSPIFKGQYDPQKEVVRGRWEFEGISDDRDTVVREVSYSRVSAGDSRFAYLLRMRPDESESSSRARASLVDPCWTLARRRWAFAVEAVLWRVQVQMGSLKVLRRGMQDRRRWLQVSVFEDAGLLVQDDDTTEDQGSVGDQQLFEALESSVPTENARIYQGLAEYLHSRRVYDLGGALCDSCNTTIKHTRFTCITCRSRFGKGNNVDLCAYCFKSPKPMEDCAFVHVGSHSLIRTSGRLNHFDEFGMVCQARGLSEDIKRSFRRDVSERKNDTADQGKDSGVNLSPMKCACCDKEVTLPCYSCLTCAIHPFFCLDCDGKEESIRRDHPSFVIHTRKHLLLRISDSTSVDTDISYDT